MDKDKYFKQALQAEAYKYRAWIISCFAVIMEDEDQWKKDPYDYRIVRTKDGYKYVLNGKLVKISNGKDVSKPMFEFLRGIDVKPNEVVNLTKSIRTTYGNLLSNYILLINPFHDKVPYLEGNWNIRKLEGELSPRVIDDPIDPKEPLKPNEIYMSQMNKHTTNYAVIEVMTQLATVSGTPKNIVPAPGIVEYKNKLVKEYGDQLKDRVKYAEYEDKLRVYDEAWLKDDPSNGKLLSGKIKNVARMRMNTSFGGGDGFEGDDPIVPITNSLAEGLPTDAKTTAHLLNISRAGSYNRGALTMFGGVTAKQVISALASFIIVDGDCGSTTTLNIRIFKENAKGYDGRYIRIGGGTERLTADAIEKKPGRVWNLRSPMYCHSQPLHICSVCAGDGMSRRKKSLSLASAGFAGIILGFYMSKMHLVALVITDMNLEEAFS